MTSLVFAGGSEIVHTSEKSEIAFGVKTATSTTRKIIVKTVVVSVRTRLLPDGRLQFGGVYVREIETGGQVTSSSCV